MQPLGGKFCSHAADGRCADHHSGLDRGRLNRSLWINRRLCTSTARDGSRWNSERTTGQQSQTVVDTLKPQAKESACNWR